MTDDLANPIAPDPTPDSSAPEPQPGAGRTAPAEPRALRVAAASGGSDRGRGPTSADLRPRRPEYRGGELDPDRGPGLGCFWFQVLVLAFFLLLIPIGVNLNWPFELLAVLLFVVIGLLLLTGQTVIFLLRLVAADRRTRGRRRPIASRTKTVGEMEEELAVAPADAVGPVAAAPASLPGGGGRRTVSPGTSRAPAAMIRGLTPDEVTDGRSAAGRGVVGEAVEQLERDRTTLGDAAGTVTQGTGPVETGSEASRAIEGTMRPQESMRDAQQPGVSGTDTVRGLAASADAASRPAADAGTTPDPGRATESGPSGDARPADTEPGAGSVRSPDLGARRAAAADPAAATGSEPGPHPDADPGSAESPGADPEEPHPGVRQ